MSYPAVHPVVILGMLCVIFLLFGCFVYATVLLVLLVPVIFPTVVGFGFDPRWFGVVVIILCMTGLITPPVGANAYVVKGVAKEVPLQSIFRGILPFLIPFLITLALLTAFPQIATFLPSLVTY